MGRRKYGSKAAYEAARGPIRAEREEWERKWNMSEEERQAEREAERKRRNADRLEDDAMMTHMMFMASSMASGADAKKAAIAADQAVAELKKRFT